MPDDAKCAECIEMKWFERTSRNARAYIAGERARFANGELRGRRANVSGFRIRHDRAVA